MATIAAECDPSLQQDMSPHSDNNAEVVTMEPRSQMQKTLDKNGEEIIFEGIHEFHDPCIHLFSAVCIILLVILCTCGLLLPFIPYLVVMWTCEYKYWELYLTQDAIHHTKNALRSRGCCLTHWVIPLKEIKDISLMKSNKILINVGSENIYKYISIQYLRITTNSIEILGVENAEEFIAAVREKLAVYR